MDGPPQCCDVATRDEYRPATPADLAWNLLLLGTNATGINVDIPLTPLSFQDLGSGVLAFAASATVLGLLVDPDERARRVVVAAVIAGAVATVFDIFVL